jgi:hypothetical protein
MVFYRSSNSGKIVKKTTSRNIFKITSKENIEEYLPKDAYEPYCHHMTDTRVKSAWCIYSMYVFVCSGGKGKEGPRVLEFMLY